MNNRVPDQEEIQKEKEAEAAAAAWMGYPTTPGFIGGPGITGPKASTTTIGDEEIEMARAIEALRRARELDSLRGYGFVDPLGQSDAVPAGAIGIVTSPPTGSPQTVDVTFRVEPPRVPVICTEVEVDLNDEDDIPEPSPVPLEVTIYGESFRCPNCDEPLTLSAIDKKASVCPNCESQLIVTLENENGDQEVKRKPAKYAVPVSYALEVDGKMYQCMSKRSYLRAKQLLKDEPGVFRNRLKFYADHPDRFAKAKVIRLTLSAVEADLAKRIPTQGDLEEDKPRALRF